MSKNGWYLAGVDEVGRGPLVGAVVAAAVVLDPNKPIEGLMDSKKLSEKKRERLYNEILEKAIGVAVGRAEAEEIDKINILQASLLAMKRAVEGLECAVDHVVVDGNHCPSLTVSVEAVIKGDMTIPAISAASIVAKVTRDREMLELDKVFPDYGFKAHKGYPTKAHMAALATLGPLAQHRKTFAPVARLLAADV